MRRSLGLSWMVLTGVAWGCGGDAPPMQHVISVQTGGAASGMSGTGGTATGGTATDGTCDPTSFGYADVISPLFETRCLICHSASKTGADRLGAPVGVNFDTEADILMNAAKIRLRAVDQRTMPAGAPLSDCEATQLGSYLDSVGGATCMADCSGKQCGDDGCGGSCGSCSGSDQCDSTTGMCVAMCTPSCAGVVCGDDGCGGTCDSCGSGTMCDVGSGQCVCAPDCSGKECGDDGCGGSCGMCTGGLLCNTNLSMCVSSCTGDCSGKMCGDDGCGTSCGSCSNGDVCNQGVCEAPCAPQCDGLMCGDDGCGGSCGSCLGGQQCNGGTSCDYPTVTFGAVYTILMNYGCGGVGCHDGLKAKPPLDLSDQATAYASLVNQNATGAGCTSDVFVVPGDPDQSYLVSKVTGVGICGSKMPKGGPFLTTDDVNTIRAWIGSGAGQ